MQDIFVLSNFQKYSHLNVIYYAKYEIIRTEISPSPTNNHILKINYLD